MKHRYFDQISARIVAEKRLAKGAPALKPYLCEFCQGWHLTKKLDFVKQQG